MASANKHLKAVPPHLEFVEITNSGETAIAAGALHLEVGLLGVAYETIAAGEDGLLIVSAPAPGMDVLKVQAEAVSRGDILFYNPSSGETTGEASHVEGEGEGEETIDHRFFGFALAAAEGEGEGEGEDGDTHVTARFGPTFPYTAP